MRNFFVQVCNFPLLMGLDVDVDGSLLELRAGFVRPK